MLLLQPVKVRQTIPKRTSPNNMKTIEEEIVQCFPLPLSYQWCLLAVHDCSFLYASHTLAHWTRWSKCEQYYTPQPPLLYINIHLTICSGFVFAQKCIFGPFAIRLCAGLLVPIPLLMVFFPNNNIYWYIFDCECLLKNCWTSQLDSVQCETISATEAGRLTTIPMIVCFVLSTLSFVYFIRLLILEDNRNLPDYWYGEGQGGRSERRDNIELRYTKTWNSCLFLASTYFSFR